MRSPFKHSLRRAAIVLAAIVATSLAQAETWTIEHVGLIDGRGTPLQRDMTVVVDGERIASVLPSAVAGSARGKVIDGRGKVLMPGLMDIHIHLRGVLPGLNADGTHKTDPALAESLLASYLYLGFTTVLDLGNPPEHIVRERIEERAGRIRSPRIFAAGNMVVYPGAKGDSVGIRIADFERDKPLLDRHIALQQPDIVKLTLDEQGWGDTPMVPLMSAPLLRQIIEYYNLRGIRSTVHVTNELRSLEAIYAGADSLAHPVIQGPETDAFVKLMAAKKIPFATTLTIGDNYSRLVDHPEFLDQPDYVASFSPAERQRQKTELREQYRGRYWTTWRKIMLPVNQENIARIVQAGGIAALGTDQSSGPAAHREMQLLVQAGLTPLQVITIATGNAAVFLGKADVLGTVEPTKLADLVLLNADPTTDIERTRDIAFVMKNGEIVDESRLPLAGGRQPRRFPVP
jgi:imidazolonepropionase-like amidohydrolase